MYFRFLECCGFVLKILKYSSNPVIYIKASPFPEGGESINIRSKGRSRDFYKLNSKRNNR